MCSFAAPARAPSPVCVQELQQQNARLLVVNRELASQAEATRAEAEAAVRGEYEGAVARLSKELDALRASRRGTEEMLAQVKGQGQGRGCVRWH